MTGAGGASGKAVGGWAHGSGDSDGSADERRWAAAIRGEGRAGAGVCADICLGAHARSRKTHAVHAHKTCESRGGSVTLCCAHRYIVMAYVGLADTVMAYIGMADIVMAHIGIADIVMAHIVMAEEGASLYAALFALRRRAKLR